MIIYSFYEANLNPQSKGINLGQAPLAVQPNVGPLSGASDSNMRSFPVS